MAKNKVVIEYRGYRIRHQKTRSKGRVYVRFGVDFGRNEKGNRQRRNFASESAAKRAIREHLDKATADAEARAILEKRIGEKSKELSADDLLDAARGLRILKGSGTLETAARFYVEHTTPPEGGPKTIEQFVAEHIASKEKAGRRHATVIDLRHRLGKLSEKLGARPIHEVTKDDLDRALDEYGYKGATRNTFRRHWQTFFRSAIRAKHATHNPALDLEKVGEDEQDIDYFTPDEAEAAMSVVAAYDAEHGTTAVPYFAVALWSGIRPAEIARLDWRNVAFRAGRIRVTGKAAKTRRKRRVDMADNLVAWLTQYRMESGPVAPSDRTLRAVRAEIKQKVRWSHDIMRHTFGTYHYAEHENIGKTARQLGNDIRTAERHYADAEATREDAKQFWAIRPKRGDNVITLKNVG